MVCNGHYSEPRVPSIPGADTFPGRQLHTHNFRDKEPFEGQVVVVMGASASGNDIVREIAEVADQVGMHILFLSPLVPKGTSSILFCRCLRRRTELTQGRLA